MKRICMISQSSYPFDPRVKREAEALEKDGYELDLICLAAKDQLKTEVYGKLTVHRILGEVNQEKIYKYVITSALFFLIVFAKLQLLHYKRRFDVIQIHNMPDFHVFTAVIQKLMGVPVILDIHDLTAELFKSKWKKNKNKFLIKIILLAEKLSTGFSDKVITVTEGCKQILMSRGVPEEKITLVLNTPERKNFSFENKREYETIHENAKVLYHGTVAERFGIHVVIESFAKFVKLVPGSVFNVYGRYDPEYREYLEKRIKHLRLEDNVFLYPRISLEEVQYIIQDADIGVVPYVSNDYMNIALSTKAFEYSSMGLPMVATRLHTLSLTFPQSSIMYAKDRDANDWAKKLHSLCAYPDLRSSLADNALKIVSEISGDQMMKRYVKLINNTVKNNENYRVEYSTKSLIPKKLLDEKN
jgi:glycosyltransferase involved in cell wall biosynthesis